MKWYSYNFVKPDSGVDVIVYYWNTDCPEDSCYVSHLVNECVLGCILSDEIYWCYPPGYKGR